MKSLHLQIVSTILLAAVAGATVPTRVSAAETEGGAGESGTERIEEIVVVAGSLQAKAGRGTSFSALDTAAIDRIRPTHPAEVLSQIPGVWITRGSGQEHLTAIRSATLTGAGSCGAFLLLEDGIPIRPTGFCNVNNLFEMNIEQASAVEVWRGPGSAVLGGNAMKGAINVITRMPDATRIGVEGGSYGHGQIRMENRTEVGGFAWGITANATRSDGYQSQTGLEQYKLNSVLEGLLGEWEMRATLSGTVLHQETAGFVVGTDAYEDGVLRRSNPNPEAFRDAWSARLAVQFSRDAWTIVPYARRSQMNFIQHFLVGKPLEDNDQTSAGMIVGHRFEGDTLVVNSGLQIEAFRGGLREFQEAPSIGSPFIVSTRPQGLHYDYEVDGRSAAGFYDLDLAIGERWHLLHSGRVEWQEFDYDNKALDGNTRDDGQPCALGNCLYTRPADRKDSFTDVAGRLGVSVDLFADQQLFFTVGSGFRPPQAVELYRLQSGQQVADLNSEELLSVEAGYRSGWLQAAAFAERTRNVILRDSSGFNISEGRTKSHGIELSSTLAADPSDFSASLTWARHRYDFNRALGGGETINKGDDVDTAPRFMGYLRWGYQITESLHQELDLNWVDKYYTNADNTRRYEGNLVMNWRGEWQATPELQVFARIINLTNDRYADRADFAFGNDRYFIAMPRQYYLGVNYTFD